MKRVLFALTVLVGIIIASINSAHATTIRVKNVAEDERPPQTAVVGGVFSQSLTFEVVFKDKDKYKTLTLDNFGVGGFNTVESEKTAQDLGKYAKEVYLIANTSPGNSVPSEMTIIAYAVITEDTGTIVTMYNGTHKFKNHARFTAIFIPRDDLTTGDTIGLFLNSFEARDSITGEKVDVVGKFPMFGTEQPIDTSIGTGKVYIGKTVLTIGGNVYSAIFIHPEWGNLLLKKIVFRDYLNKNARLSVWYNGKDYKCLVDPADGLTSCAFYKRYPELSPSKSSISLEQLGVPIYGGNWVYIYSKNDPQIFNHLSDLMDVVVVGIDLNYRYLPVPYEDGGGMACFRAGTKIKMADGPEKDIETVKIGDLVWTGPGKSAKVVKVIQKTDPVWTIVNSTRTVPDQLFFCCDEVGDEVLKPAGLITVSDWVKNDDGGMTKIVNLKGPFAENVPTWDLILESGCNFYYADGYKVHSVVQNVPELP